LSPPFVEYLPSNLARFRSKQPQLVAQGRFEQVATKRNFHPRQAMFATGYIEPGPHQLGPWALPAHPGEKIRVIVPSAAK
jgi:hypothetical protein